MGQLQRCFGDAGVCILFLGSELEADDLFVAISTARAQVG